MIPPEEMEVLMEKHAKRITSDPRLTKAARLSAIQEKVLRSPKIPLGIKQAKVKSLATKISKAVRRYKKGPLSSEIVDAPREEQTKAFEELLKKILRPRPTRAIPLAPKKIKKKKASELSKLIPSSDWIPYQTRIRTRHAQQSQP